METKNYFYNRFVNEENLKNIGDINIQRKYCKHSILFPIFLGESVLLASLVGYNFENLFSICIFVFIVLFFLLALYSLIRFIFLDKKYHVFKKRLYLIGFIMGHLVLAIIFYIIPIFTTKFTLNPDNTFVIRTNPGFFFLIYVPLYFGYIIFCYYAFIQCFGKYTKTGMLHYKKLNQQNENKKELEDESSNSNEQ